MHGSEKIDGKFVRIPPPPQSKGGGRGFAVPFYSVQDCRCSQSSRPWMVACEQETHFRSSPLSLFFGGREATTGNASAVRGLQDGGWTKDMT